MIYHKVYKFGMRKPSGPIATELEHQILDAHRYYNDLADLENDHRNQVEATLLLDPEYRSARDLVREHGRRLGDLRKRIQSLKAESRTNVDTPTEDAAAKVAKADFKLACDKTRLARKVAMKAMKGDIDKLAALRTSRHKEIRKQLKGRLPWGTYTLIDEAVAQATQTTKPWARLRRREWTGSAQLGLGLSSRTPEHQTLHDIEVGLNTYFQLGEPDTRGWRQFRFRIGSDPKNQTIPIWYEGCAKFHRSLPSDASIPVVKMVREVKAGIPKWSLQLTVETAQLTPSPTPTADVAAIDIGWARRNDGSFRIGYLKDSEGLSEEIVLSKEIVDAITKPASLRSIRDRNQTQLASQLLSWLSDVGNACPDWLKEAARYMHNWKGSSKFWVLWHRWTSSRFDNDGPGYDLLSAWIGQDRHLELWEVNQRTKSLRRRREHYRVFAARLAERHRELKLENFDLRNVARKPKPEEHRSGGARDDRTLVAIGEFVACLTAAFESRGRTVAWAPAAYTSQTCSTCHGRTKLVPGTRSQTCNQCGVEFDRDENAATNILASNPVVGVAPEALATSKLAKTRRNRRKARTDSTSGVVVADRCSKTETQMPDIVP